MRVCLFLCTLSSLLVGKEPSLQTEYATSCQKFSFSLYEAVKKQEENLLLSPYSIFTCLSMAYFGAAGTTEKEVQQALFITTERGYFSQVAQTINQGLLKKNIHSANGFWADQDTFFLSQFRHTIEQDYQGQIAALNFNKQEESSSIINEWTKNQTEGKIEKLLEPDDLKSGMRLLLTNAIYFQGSWALGFNPSKSRSLPFKKSASESVPVMMMHQDAAYPYYEDDQLQVISLPISGGKIAALFFLPKTDSFLNLLFTASTFEEYLSKMEEKSIQVVLPKFSLRQRFYLKEGLEALGIKEAFSEKANFSLVDGMRDLYLDQVIHEALFSIDETGVLATGATNASLGLTSMPKETTSLLFLADHPFICMLIDLDSRIPLFIAEVQNPS